MASSVTQHLPGQTGPIDRVAARVVRKAAPEDLWAPETKAHADPRHKQSNQVLRTTKAPPSVPPRVTACVGKRRGRLTVIGYAEDQGGGVSAKWVVRCDCGNFEHRKRIFRWLHTQAPDACHECRNRWHLLGMRYPEAPAVRAHGAELAHIRSI